VFPGETVEVQSTIPTSGVDANWVRVTGYNTPPAVVPVG
jgi:exo-1,4-beta-D-glucosaminidase